MTETISALMDMIATATPKQLSELSTLLENDPARIQPAGPEASLAPRDRPVPAPSAAPTPSDAPPPPDAPTSSDAPTPPDAPPPPAAQAPLDAPTPSAAITPSAAPTERSLPPPDPRTERSVARLPSSQTERTVPLAPAPLVVRQGPRAAELLTRGQAAERQGNVSGARRFYATAADQGSATAARSLGRLYDPGYLQQMALGGIDPDPDLARHWYERAVAMGDAQAGPLLQALAAR